MTVARQTDLGRVAGRLLDVLLSELELLGATEEGFALARWITSFLVDNTCGVYRCDTIEELLVSHMDASLGSAINNPSRGEAIHVLTEPYPHGGHTRVARHLLAQTHGTHDVLLTRLTANQNAHAWLGVRQEQVRSSRELCSRARVQALAAEISAYPMAYLYLHPDDIDGAVAVRLAQRIRPDLRVGFFNHADHAFSVAIGAADCVFEISTYGWQLRNARGCEDKSTFVGIPIEPFQAHQPQDIALVADRPRMITAGAAYKYKPVGTASLPHALDCLLDAVPELQIDLAGPSPVDAWWKPLIAKHGGRLHFRGLIPHAEYLQLLQRSNCFIDSHPKTGGTALPEALLAGASVVGLLGGTWGFSLADALRVSDDAAFVARCHGLLNGDDTVAAQQARVRSACAEFHAPASVWQRMRLAMRDGMISEPHEELNSLGAPPILAENEWLAHGQIQLRLPDRSAKRAGAVHSAVARAHSRAFGAIHPGSIRLALTWLVRHAFRST